MKPLAPPAWTPAPVAALLLIVASTIVLRSAPHPSAAPPAGAPAPAPTLAVEAPVPAEAAAASDCDEASMRFAAPGAAGMRIAIDPESGELRMPEHARAAAPTLEALQAMAREEGAGLVTVRHADGSESIAHEGRFTDHTVLRIGPDGNPYFVCAHGTHGVQGALAPNLPLRRALEEE